VVGLEHYEIQGEVSLPTLLLFQKAADLTFLAIKYQIAQVNPEYVKAGCVAIELPFVQLEKFNEQRARTYY
jgi:hypothetical protein